MSTRRGKNNHVLSQSERPGRKTREGEPQTTTHNPRSQTSVRRTSFSPALAANLPLSSVNKNKSPDTSTVKPVRTNIPRLRSKISSPNHFSVSSASNENSSSKLSPKPTLSMTKTKEDKSKQEGDNMSRAHIKSTGSKAKVSDDQQDTLTLVLAELKDIKQEIKQQGSKLDAIENTTASLAEQLSGVIGRTVDLETAVTTNAAGIRDVNDQLCSIKAAVAKQGKSLASIVTLKEDIKESSTKTLRKMNELVDTQGEQVEAFKSSTKVIKQDIMSEVDKQIKKIKEENYCQSFKNQAYNSRKNLIVVGLAEEGDSSAVEQVKNFFKQTLKIKEVFIKSAYRIGDKPDDGSGYARPISVKFRNVADRNHVWRNRMDITSTHSEHSKIRVLADLPKPLREGIQALYKVANAAAKMDKFRSAKVREYQLELNDETYQFSELESLPTEIRPSTLSTPRSESALAFFSKHSYFSNHFLSDMEIDGQIFSCMEQYLAFQRAILSEKQSVIRKARQARDPLQAKYILNLLREDHADEWNGLVEEVTLEGLRAKFEQNTTLKTFLDDTGNLQIGEASDNPRWGIGMTLSDEDVLDHTKWNGDGNLLGRSLMKIREELRAKSSAQIT